MSANTTPRDKRKAKRELRDLTAFIKLWRAGLAELEAEAAKVAADIRRREAAGEGKGAPAMSLEILDQE